MNIPNLSRLKGAFNIGKAIVAAHRPEILLATSVVGGIASTILGAKGGYEARGIVDAEQRRRDNQVDGEGVIQPSAPLTAKEKADLTWKCYVPAGVALVGSVGSTTGLHFVHVKEKKALVTAGALALEEAREKFKAWEAENTIGTMSNEEKQKVLDDRAKNTPIGEENNSHVQNSDGEIEELYLVRDPQTGRDIWSNKARIEEAIVEVGNTINGSRHASLNEFYVNAGYQALPQAYEFGWSGVLPSISWTDENGMPITGVRDDGRPFRGFRFRPEPEKDYDADA